ncbi:TetR/AcrR family transcriptional regulator [Sphingobium aromaticiconvertens]|uniref:TetR/AcrR family transcriptional regulator n=1 Tax=Sphingobium aromaticiconvertens TaxID=365341 RepID=UPI003016147F
MWGSQGHGSISARTLSREADAPVSSIYHHFENMEHLFLLAQQQAKAAAERWCHAQLEALAEAGMLSPDAFPALFAALIDDWCENNRSLAFAWRECQLMAMRDPQYVPVLRDWQALWRDFWQDICARCDLAAHGALTTHMFDGESLFHLMRWRRMVDRACLDETCRGWSEWLSGRLASDGEWRLFAREQAAREMPELKIRGEIMERIAHAAAKILARQGIAGLTHRAVAAQAELTLGVVSYNFRSSADLARAAFEVIYRQAVALSGGAVAKEENSAALDLTMSPGDHRAIAKVLPALDELLVAVARSPDMRAFAPQLRYWRGRTSRGALQAMIGPKRPVSHLDGALFSGLMTGHRRICIGLPAEDAWVMSNQQILRLQAVLGAGTCVDTEGR